MKEALVLYGATAMGTAEFSADLRWRTGGFSVPDPVLFCEIGGKKILFVSSLEVERAAKEAKVDEIILLDAYVKKSKKENLPISVIFLKEQRIEKVIVPATIRHQLAENLAAHFEIQIRDEPFYPERAIKTPWEIGEIEKAQRAVEAAVVKGTDFIKDCSVRGNELFHSAFGDQPINSFHLRKIIDDELFLRGYLGVESIVACGIEATDPHAAGSGLLHPKEPIVLDIFPRSLETLYFADQTRTIFKGMPSENLCRMYGAVLEAQELAIAMVKPGANGAKIEQAVRDFFTKSGYPTSFTERPVKGFIHSLGHGVGLEIHEAPSLSSRPEVLQAGQVVTIEPGLYYSTAEGEIPAGGIRIEDMLLVTADGSKNLTKFPKKLEDMIL
ncbi:MAG: hypothetical protein A3C11_01960 [Candidatus Sungbacteria bacterium RIFCSPHIGHO2_02_FULL_49_12]|uniref:Peptidase M24 domain-containing protein n=1 Tax=Candidatus Sungbacteria bacterium RIFCSPHIGHO2_02_FULL_49_12 TaxID=1802271 RepID=A0A1G2KP62_9BACT|nr:MAG: hypothetical protein A3C11_01960 [Candidatus Sungbacteria bacterium RIFCSPHIGHO2_02_FULL_49_12]